MSRFLIIVVLVLAVGWYFLPARASYKFDKVATIAPVQTPTRMSPFQVRGYLLTPVADFVVNARLLSKSIYTFDKGADLVPVDYALGWLSMANPIILKDINISQSGRFYHWYAAELPMDRSDIETQSANMHLIPATDEIEKQLKAMPEGSLVRLTGQLVNILETKSGWTWMTSTTRGDTGFGACEVIYVTEVIKGF